MPLTFMDRVGMMLRKTPVKPIKHALEAAQAGGLDVSVAQLEAHLLCGGDPARVVEAILLARDNGIPGGFEEMTAIELGGSDPVAAVAASSEVKRYEFSTFDPDRSEELVGFVRDGTGVRARCTVTYRPPLSLVWGWEPSGLHRQLSGRIAVLINTSADARALQHHRAAHEEDVLAGARGMVETVERVDLEYAVEG